jgi:hypothetical protein
MKITFQMDSEADHESLVIIWNLMVAAELRETLKGKGIEANMAWEVVESATFGLASLLDDSQFVINGKIYRPRIAFVEEDGNLLPGAAEFDYAHEYATVFEEDLAESDVFKIEY